MNKTEPIQVITRCHKCGRPSRLLTRHKRLALPVDGPFPTEPDQFAENWETVWENVDSYEHVFTGQPGKLFCQASCAPYTLINSPLFEYYIPEELRDGDP